MRDTTDVDEPWYRNPWVWLLVAIPALTVAGCLVTIYLALSHPFTLVGDDASVPPARAEDGARQ